ncbi:unnamed protein product [Cyprideis torosa]|uniref:Transgelin n=1 Tax=Cyprideis torosa TaxID=163714 RepID=A0A7R8W1J7_9CRUS|nr:unnamed protein product [Cyprideis torosa]CAG0880976.1 unnamed protein product [Cyprideis torosa]
MAYHGPAYGLSRECQMKAQAKFDLDRANQAIQWVEAMLEQDFDLPGGRVTEASDFARVLKDGTALCHLINRLRPGAVSKINTMKAPFKQRENIEMFVKACQEYGLKNQDIFQVNDLYENKNLYMVVDCLYALGGLAQKNGFKGPVIGVRIAQENRRNFTPEQLAESNKIIGLQYGSNKGASQSGMAAYGSTRQIIPDELHRKRN